MCGRYALGVPGKTRRERFQTIDEPEGPKNETRRVRPRRVNSMASS